MSIYNKMVKAIDDCNLDDYLSLLHDDYVFVRHQSIKKLLKLNGYLLLQECLMQ